MSQYTIRRKLFAFKAEAWEGIKSHKGESAEADKHYEAYKRKYAKEIEEHERGSFRANTSSSSSTNSSSNQNTNRKSSTNTNNRYRKTSGRNWDKFWEDFEKDWNDINEKWDKRRKEAEEAAKKREENFRKEAAEKANARRVAEEMEKKANKKRMKIGLGAAAVGIAGISAYDYFKNKRKKKQKSNA